MYAVVQWYYVRSLMSVSEQLGGLSLFLSQEVTHMVSASMLPGWGKKKKKKKPIDWDLAGRHESSSWISHFSVWDDNVQIGPEVLAKKEIGPCGLFLKCAFKTSLFALSYMKKAHHPFPHHGPPITDLYEADSCTIVLSLLWTEWIVQGQGSIKSILEQIQNVYWVVSCLV